MSISGFSFIRGAWFSFSATDSVVYDFGYLHCLNRFIVVFVVDVHIFFCIVKSIPRTWFGRKTGRLLLFLGCSDRRSCALFSFFSLYANNGCQSSVKSPRHLKEADAALSVNPVRRAHALRGHYNSTFSLFVDSTAAQLQLVPLLKRCVRFC